LIELLVVMGIIAVIAGLVVPAVKGFKESGAMAAASRQLADDLGLARLRAINDRTTVYVIFVPPGFWTTPGWTTNGLTPVEARVFNNALGGQYTDYVLYAPRSVGDQPGSPYRQYLTEWRSLPEGVFIPDYKFTGSQTDPNFHLRALTNGVDFPFPLVTSAQTLRFPYIAFNPLGQIAYGRDEIIPLARGSIFYPRDPVTDVYLAQPADVVETPPGNSINNYNRLRVSWLTGRAKVERPEMP
jgi:hypothetical protein